MTKGYETPPPHTQTDNCGSVRRLNGCAAVLCSSSYEIGSKQLNTQQAKRVCVLAQCASMLRTADIMGPDGYAKCFVMITCCLANGWHPCVPVHIHPVSEWVRRLPRSVCAFVVVGGWVAVGKLHAVQFQVECDLFEKKIKHFWYWTKTIWMWNL